MITKEMLFSEFDVARQKDAKKKKNDYAHSIAYLKEHAVAKKNHPNQYRHLDIKFDNLIKMYESGDPDMYMYKKFGIEPYWMKQQREEQEEKEKKKKEKNAKKDTYIESVDSFI